MTTDRDTLTQIQYALIETPDGGATVSSGLWTTTELINAINTAQQWVTTIASPVFARTSVVTIPNQSRYELPQDWLITKRVSWTRPDGTITQLVRDTSWSADAMHADWSYNLSTAAPLVYTDFDPPFVQIQVMPASQDAGILSLLYVQLPALLSNSGINWTIPDIAVPMAKWRAIAVLLAKDGRGQDLPRAQMAQALADQGMAALQLLLKGWA